MNEAGMNEAGRDAAAMLWTGAVTGVLLRGAAWVFSAFAVGPVLGVLDLVAADYLGQRTTLFWQAIITVAAVLAAILCGLGLHSDPARHRHGARLLASLFIADIVVYLAPLILLAVYDDFTSRQGTLFGIALVGNLALAGLSLLIILRTAEPRATALTVGDRQAG